MLLFLFSNGIISIVVARFCWSQYHILCHMYFFIEILLHRNTIIIIQLDTILLIIIREHKQWKFLFSSQFVFIFYLQFLRGSSFRVYAYSLCGCFPFFYDKKTAVGGFVLDTKKHLLSKSSVKTMTIIIQLTKKNVRSMWMAIKRNFFQRKILNFFFKKTFE